MAKRNFKITCVGLTEHAQPARLTFYVYGVESADAAFTQVRADKYNRKAMTESNINYETVELHAVRCTTAGVVSAHDTPSELKIKTKEDMELKRLLDVWRHARHPYMESHND